MDHMNLELKELSADDGLIKGYGSVFNNPDLCGDVVMPGAFDESLRNRKPVMLSQHDSTKVIGVWTKLESDDHGLYVEGQLANTPLGNEIKELIRIGAIESLSIGYRTVTAENREPHRHIVKADLWEVSVVTFPMNREALIIKSYDEIRDLLNERLSLLQ